LTQDYHFFKNKYLFAVKKCLFSYYSRKYYLNLEIFFRAEILNRKNSFAEVLKNLADTDLKIILFRLSELLCRIFKLVIKILNIKILNFLHCHQWLSSIQLF